LGGKMHNALRTLKPFSCIGKNMGGPKNKTEVPVAVHTQLPASDSETAPEVLVPEFLRGLQIKGSFDLRDKSRGCQCLLICSTHARRKITHKRIILKVLMGNRTEG
jgi:hypothetical protein